MKFERGGFALGVVFGAVYMLVMLKKVLFGGNLSGENRLLKDLSPRDWASLVPLCFLIILLGVRPAVVTTKMEKSIDAFANRLGVPEVKNASQSPVVEKKEKGRS